MESLANGLILAFLATAAAVPFLRHPAKAFGWVDRPGGRKKHHKITPLTGGPAMALGLLAGLATLRPDQPFTLGALGLLFLLGLLDDRIDLSATLKLAGKIIAALAMVFGDGLVVSEHGVPFGFSLSLGVLSAPFTILLIVGFLSALNMADGSDGLAGSITLISVTALMLIGHFAKVSPAPLAGLTVAITLAFLLYNFPFRQARRAKIFMGDSGSLLLGGLIAVSAIDLSQRAGNAVPPMLVAAVLALPVFDCLILMGRRMAKGQSPMQADRDHLHFIFERAGLGKRSIVLLIGAGLALVSAFATLLWLAKAPDYAITVLLAAVFWGHLTLMRRAWRSAQLLRTVSNLATPASAREQVPLRVILGAGEKADDKTAETSKDSPNPTARAPKVRR